MNYFWHFLLNFFTFGFKLPKEEWFKLVFSLLIWQKEIYSTAIGALFIWAMININKNQYYSDVSRYVHEPLNVCHLPSVIFKIDLRILNKIVLPLIFIRLNSKSFHPQLSWGDEEFALIITLLFMQFLYRLCIVSPPPPLPRVQAPQGARTTFSPCHVHFLRCLAALCTLWSTQYLLFDVSDKT